MLNIKKDQNGNALTIALEGRLDTTSAPELEAEVKAALEGVTELTFDINELQYISSAGLRVLLMAQKTMNKQGNMIVTGANEDIRDIFDVTGFTDILTIK
ncbi:MAG: STAS domain-containing protein [Lachnospiraceae bacterium]|nr:STAS domain-containing protein [Lachnospiraceae bacterium]